MTHVSWCRWESLWLEIDLSQAEAEMSMVGGRIWMTMPFRGSLCGLLEVDSGAWAQQPQSSKLSGIPWGIFQTSSKRQCWLLPQGNSAALGESAGSARNGSMQSGYWGKPKDWMRWILRSRQKSRKSIFDRIARGRCDIASNRPLIRDLK